jgi:peptidoglycan/xylan/chitin deacetylase (PgdA/CDA1 family)
LLLFLTYHRVLVSPHPKPEFYDILASTLETHLQILNSSSLHPLKPRELLEKLPEKPSFILSFDDGTIDHFEVVLPLLVRYSCEAIFFVPTAKLSRTGYLTNDMVRQMSQSRQYIGLHSHEHRRMDTMTEPEIREQMHLCHAELEKLTGARSSIFAPPGGFINARVRSAAVGSGVKAIRTMRWGYNKKLRLENLQCAPINSRTTEKKFNDILHYRNMNFAYGLKETLKAILPMSLYQRMRDRFYAQNN